MVRVRWVDGVGGCGGTDVVTDQFMNIIFVPFISLDSF